jgi:hypothetical protein
MRLHWHRDIFRRGRQGKALATVHGSDASGWWWSAGCADIGVPRLDSRTMLVGTEAEAKSAAARYVRSFMNNRKPR